jgi:hypothetical protein
MKCGNLNFLEPSGPLQACNGTDLSFFYVNILRVSAHTIKKNTEYLLAASKKNGLEVDADKTKNKVMSRGQNAVQNHSIKNENSSFERVGQFKYLGIALMNQNSIQEEIESRLNSGNACFRSVQNLLFSSLLSKYINIYRTKLCLLFYMGVKLGRSH